jgi:hypothetical protein
MADSRNDKTLMRSIGEFFGHIIKGAKTDVTKTKHRRTISKNVTEVKHGSVTFRETRIREVEIDQDH